MMITDLLELLPPMDYTLIDDDRLVTNIENESGRGTMTVSVLFPGVVLIQNDFTMDACDSGFTCDCELFAIDHCRDGRMEWELNADTYLYVEPGTVNANTRKDHRRRFTFPLKHYQGISIVFFLDQAAEGFRTLAPGLSLDLPALKEKLSPDDRTFITRAIMPHAYNFDPLYERPDEKNRHYLLAKVFELVAYLNSHDCTQEAYTPQYFHRIRVQKVKEIAEFICSDLQEHHTLKDLSRQFDIPLTTMKQCFKGVYGVPVYSYLRRFRIDAAALKLLQTENTITDIALSVGYENASKFAAAFRDELGVAPQEYRQQRNGPV